MVKEFRFKETGKEIKIEGESYYVNVADPLVIGALTDIASKYTNIEASLNKEENIAKQMKKILEDLLVTIDAVLGEGSAEKIFKDKKADFVNTTALLNFISESVFDEIDNFKEKYSIKQG